MQMPAKRIACLTLTLLATLGTEHSLQGMFDWFKFDFGSGISNQDQALLKAAKKGDLEAFKRALNNGGSLQAEDLFGKNSLHLACEHAHPDIVMLILGKNGSIEVRDHRSKTALCYACEAKSVKIIQALLSRGAKLTPEFAKKYETLIEQAIATCPSRDD